MTTARYWLLAGVWVAGCAGGKTKGEADCDPACAAGQLCVDNGCRDLCNSESDCDEGYVCSLDHGYCVHVGSYPGDPGPDGGDPGGGGPCLSAANVGDPCAAQSCTDGVVELARTCAADLSCPSAGQQSCDGYACDGDRCGETCASSADCVSGYVCQTATSECFPDGTATALASTITAAPTSCVPPDGVTPVEVTITLIDGDGDPVVDVTPTFTASGTGNVITMLGATDASGEAHGELTSTVGEAKTLSVSSPAGLETVTTEVVFSTLYLSITDPNPQPAYTDGTVSVPDVADDLGGAADTLTRTIMLVNDGAEPVEPTIVLGGGEAYGIDGILMGGTGADGFSLDRTTGCYDGGSPQTLPNDEACPLILSFLAGEDGFAAGTYWTTLYVEEPGGGCSTIALSAHTVYEWSQTGTTTATSGQDCASECACDAKGKTYLGGFSHSGGYTELDMTCSTNTSIPEVADCLEGGSTHCCIITMAYGAGCTDVHAPTYHCSNNACANCAQPHACSAPSYYYYYTCE